MKKPGKKEPPRPRNVAAKALREGQFRPRVEDNPKAYKRRPRHKPDLAVPPADEDKDLK
jgi:hypothetical protein